MSDPSKSYQEQLRLLRLAFLESCVSRGQLIEAVYKQLQQDPDGSASVALVQNLCHETHKLTGAAGSFGFQPLSDMARQVEQRCSTLLTRNAAPDASDLTLVEKLLQQIREVVHIAGDQ